MRRGDSAGGAMTDFFKEIEREAEKLIKKHLETVEALDAMEDDVDSYEAGFLETALRQLREGRGLTQRQIEFLNSMSDKYGIG